MKASVCTQNMSFTEPHLPLPSKYSEVPVNSETEIICDRTVISHKDTCQPLTMFSTPKVSNSLRQSSKKLHSSSRGTRHWYVQEKISIGKQPLLQTAATINMFISKHSIRKTYCESQKQHMPHFVGVAMMRGFPFLLHFREITGK